MTTEIQTPDGVDPDDCRIEHEALAFAPYREHDEWAGEDLTYDKPFDPRSGRWYDLDAFPEYDSLKVSGALSAKCAYEDCDGKHEDLTVSTRITAGDQCRKCGAAYVGRDGFSDEAEDRRSAFGSKSSNRSAMKKKADKLRDEWSKEMARCIDAGLGVAAATDFLMCSVGDIPIEEWAAARDVSARAVRRNMKKCARALGETVTFTKRSD